MLANFFIGIREGLEAALIVSILVAYLVKLDRKKDVSKIFIGLAAAIGAAVLVGLILSFIDSEVSDHTEVILSGTFSLIAVGFITWMIFWMAAQSRSMSSSLRGKIDTALDAKPWSLAAVAFFAVMREGVETALFLWTASRSTGSDTNPDLGAGLGLIAAAALGVLIYRGALKLNLGVFFKWTGAFLILVTAGITAYGIGELQEINVLPFLTERSYDLTGLIPEGSLLDTALRGTIAFNSNPTWLQSIAWVAYFAVVGGLFANQYRTKKTK